MPCCCVDSLQSEFDRRTAKRDLRRYRRRGPLPASRQLLDAIRERGVAGRTILDIGGGIGAVTHELLRSGASGATMVDASSAYLKAAAEEAERQEHRQPIEFRHGDVVELADELPVADIVTLDRVICCYPDLEALLHAAAGRARWLIGLVYPRELWWLRMGLAAVNLSFRVRRRDFRVFMHPTVAVEAVLNDHGFSRQQLRTTVLWQVALYAR